MKYSEILKEHNDFALTCSPEDICKYHPVWEGDPRIGDGEDNIELNPSNVKEAQDFLRNFGNEITLYRAMAISEWRLNSESALGRCWTWDKPSAVAYETGKSNILIFEGIVTKKDVDWLATIALFQTGEKEIRLDIDAKIKLLSIENRNSEKVREDLYGRIFDAWIYV